MVRALIREVQKYNPEFDYWAFEDGMFGDDHYEKLNGED